MASCKPSSSNEFISMDVERVLHMKGGVGETSYAQNSSLQKKTTEALKHIIVESAVEAYEMKTSQSYTLADLGCSSGANALSLVGDIIEAICERCQQSARKAPEFLVFLNDLSTNDFNALFLRFPEFKAKYNEDVNGGAGGTPSVFLAGIPSTFYTRILPNNSLNFIYSCYSLHWLSKVPPGLFDKNGKSINRGKMYISHTSPPDVAACYFKQFQKDFNLFLKSRSVELTFGGRMVLTMLGRQSQDHTDGSKRILWEALADSFALMVSQGLIDEEKVDTYNVPFYAPSVKEIEDEVCKEGSFVIEKIQISDWHINSGDPKEDARITSMAVRAVQESMICHHFGSEIVDALFQTYAQVLAEIMVKEEITSSHLIAILRKLR